MNDRYNRIAGDKGSDEMGRKHDEIWQELRELDNRVTRLEDRAILKPEYDPADVAFNRAKPWEWQVPTSAPVDEVADLHAENARLLAERDALRARIDGGKTIYRVGNGAWHELPLDNYTHTATLIAPAYVADERKGERRKGKDTLSFICGTISSVRNGKLHPVSRRPDSDRRTNLTGTRAMRGMTVMDKCCGNCGWWIVLQHESLSRSGRLGHCSHPMPAACLERDEMYETEGTGCPCHKEKES